MPVLVESTRQAQPFSSSYNLSESLVNGVEGTCSQTFMKFYILNKTFYIFIWTNILDTSNLSTLIETSFTESTTESFPISFCMSTRGNPQLIVTDHVYYMTDKKQNRNGRVYWRCLRHSHACRARVVTINGLLQSYKLEHNHEPLPDYLNGKIIFPTMEALNDHKRKTSSKYKLWKELVEQKQLSL